MRPILISFSALAVLFSLAFGVKSSPPQEQSTVQSLVLQPQRVKWESKTNKIDDVVVSVSIRPAENIKQ